MIKRTIQAYFSPIKKIPSVLQTSHLPSLDGLRGMSIIIVLIAHINSHYGIFILSQLFGAGIVGVYVFFVISGFLITTLLLKEKHKTGDISLKKFYIRRVLRIFPVAYLFILVIIIFNFFFNLQIPTYAFFAAGLYVVNFFQFIHVPYYFNHYWSLSAEEQFYLFIPPIIKYNFDAYRWLLFLILALSFVARFVFEHYQNNFAAKFLFDATRNLDGLIIGSFFSILVFTNLIPWSFIKKYKVAINIILIFFIFLFNREGTSFITKLFFNHTAYSFLIGFLVISNIYPSNDIFYKFFNNKWLAQVGILSYSIYIWQQLFTSSLFLPIFPYNLVLIAIVSVGSYYLYERKFLQLKAKFS